MTWVDTSKIKRKVLMWVAPGLETQVQCLGPASTHALQPGTLGWRDALLPACCLFFMVLTVSCRVPPAAGTTTSWTTTTFSTSAGLVLCLGQGHLLLCGACPASCLHSSCAAAVRSDVCHCTCFQAPDLLLPTFFLCCSLADTSYGHMVTSNIGHAEVALCANCTTHACCCSTCKAVYNCICLRISQRRVHQSTGSAIPNLCKCESVWA